MFLNLTKLILSFFDLLDRKKILNYFKRNIKGQLKCCIDVGAHHGETIKLFNKAFIIERILAFEPSQKNFEILSEKNKNIKNLEILNIGLGEKKEILNFKQHVESQSSTLVKINDESNYYKRKNFYLNFFNKNKIQFYDVQVKVDRLDNILNSKKIQYVDILKIDTEGYDFNVIKGLGEHIKNIKYIYFEHHFHNMLIKDYTLSNIHSYLEKNNFKKVFKKKMYFRKTFEYIYLNSFF